MGVLQPDHAPGVGGPCSGSSRATQSGTSTQSTPLSIADPVPEPDRDADLLQEGARVLPGVADRPGPEPAEQIVVRAAAQCADGGRDRLGRDAPGPLVLAVARAKRVLDALPE